jgi:hypothetical protein
MSAQISRHCRFRVIPAGAAAFLRWIDHAKAELLHSEVPKPPGDDPRVAHKNIIYFIMELFEERYMAALTSHLLSLAKVDSIVWIHDAIWISPHVDQQMVQRAVVAAGACTGLEGLRVNYKSLHGERAEVISKLPPLRSSAPKAVHKYARPPPGPIPRTMLASAVKQVVASRAPRHGLGADQRTLVEFFARKARKTDSTTLLDSDRPDGLAQTGP